MLVPGHAAEGTPEGGMFLTHRDRRMERMERPWRHDAIPRAVAGSAVDRSIHPLAITSRRPIRGGRGSDTSNGRRPRASAGTGGMWFPPSRSIAVPHVTPAQAYHASGNPLAAATESPFVNESVALDGEQQEEEEGVRASATGPSRPSTVKWDQADPSLPQRISRIEDAEDEKQHNELFALQGALHRFREMGVAEGAQASSVLRDNVTQAYRARKSRLAKQLQQARTRARSLATLINREALRASAMKRWGIQASYAPETARASEFGTTASLQSSHGLVMQKALANAWMGVGFRRLWRNTLGSAQKLALLKLNEGIARKLALRGPVRHAWYVWTRFVLLERYLSRARERAGAAETIQRNWRGARESE
jgi:hypothetical protein